MANKKTIQEPLTEPELQLLKQLRQHPERMARFQSILHLASDAEGPLKTADQVEELLVQEVRRLGQTTMREWAVRAEERVSQELKGQEPELRSRKKKR